jgi:hypothetical protein
LVAQLRYLAKLKATQGTLVNEYARHDLSALVRKYDAQNRADAMDLRLVEIVTASRD